MQQGINGQADRQLISEAALAIYRRGRPQLPGAVPKEITQFHGYRKGIPDTVLSCLVQIRPAATVNAPRSRG